MYTKCILLSALKLFAIWELWMKYEVTYLLLNIRCTSLEHNAFQYTVNETFEYS